MKEKINKMKFSNAIPSFEGLLRKALLWPFVGFLGAGALSAEEIRLASWRYYKELSPAVSPSGSYGVLELDSEVIKNSSLYDLRVIPFFDKGASSEASLPKRPEGLAYFIRRKELSSVKQKLEFPKLLFSKRVSKYGRQDLFELSPPEKGHSYRILDFRLPAHYEGGVSISTGPKPDELIYQGHYNLYSYQSISLKKARVDLLIPKNHKFVRVEFSTRTDIKLLRLRALPDARLQEYELSEDEAAYRIDEDADTSETRIYLANPSRRSITRIELRFRETGFRRMATVYSYDRRSKSWQQIVASNLISGIRGPRNRNSSQEKQVLALPYPVSTPIRINIQNAFDKPLTLVSLKAVAETLELLVNLPSLQAKPKSLRLYYGNEYAPEPRYEFQSIFRAAYKNGKEPGLSTLKAGRENPNPEFAYSILEPPLSIWLMRSLILLGVFVSGYLGLRVFRKLGTDKT